MKKVILLVAFALTLFLGEAYAQKTVTVSGTVRKITYSEKDPLIPLEGVEIQIETPTQSNSNGTWSTKVQAKKDGKYYFRSIIKEGYHLAAPSSLTAEQKLGDKVEIIMASHQDYFAQVKKVRGQLQRQCQNELNRLQDIKDSLELMVANQQATIEQYKKAEEEYNNYRDNYFNNHDLINEEAEKLALIDFHSLDSIEKIRYRLKTEGKWDSLILLIKHALPSDITNYADYSNALIAQKQKEIQQIKQTNLQILAHLQALSEAYKMKYINDSAAYYLQQCTTLFPDSVDLMDEYGIFLKEYLARYERCLSLRTAGDGR